MRNTLIRAEGEGGGAVKLNAVLRIALAVADNAVYPFFFYFFLVVFALSPFFISFLAFFSLLFDFIFSSYTALHYYTVSSINSLKNSSLNQ